MLESMAGALRDYLFFSERGAARAKKEGALIQALLIYATAALGTLIFYAFKPVNFPEAYTSASVPAQGFFFWLKAMLWQLTLEAAWLLFLLGLVAWLRQGRLIWRLAAGVLWTAAPFILALAHRQNALGAPALALGTAAWLSLFYPALKNMDRDQWKPVITFMIGINAVELVLLIPLTITTLAAWADAFKAVQIGGGLWLLVLGALGLRRLCDLRLPRAFMAMVLSILLQTAFALTLQQLGIIPKELFKALLYA